ncbi:SDR family NAD(P)-dependent oxidoreductase [Amnibacterium sp. CER49]|uniref:SDR family oxidoreductase n=1 Tax=Amnibacterium sp. CER49 TaxID=3039161 RepID=UPI002447B553|nr:SDR family NAD(P)-dependent oxidoreductase [Amnibacterium sp. CER49]MDH2445465.1 SDR family NAD(P)-dependent oxidoreductase [Amnibacterium sp. CER49]
MGDPRVLWVTGAGSGMGRAAAVTAAAGRRVVVSGRRREQLDGTARAVEAAGGEALVLPLDVTDTAAIADAHRELASRWGAVSDLVLSAGSNSPHRRWGDQTMEGFERIVATNLMAVAAVIEATLPDLRAARGTAVVISSYSGWSFSPGAGVAYSASKTALGSVCRNLNAQEWESGVRATHLCPGDVNTGFLELRPEVPADEVRRGMLQPEDVGRAVAFVLDSPPHVRIDELVLSPTQQH